MKNKKIAKIICFVVLICLVSGVCIFVIVNNMNLPNMKEETHNIEEKKENETYSEFNVEEENVNYIAGSDIKYEMLKDVEGDLFLIYSPIFDLQLIDMWIDDDYLAVYIRANNKNNNEYELEEYDFEISNIYVNGIDMDGFIRESYDTILIPGEAKFYKCEISKKDILNALGERNEFSDISIQIRLLHRDNMYFSLGLNPEMISENISLPIDEVNEEIKSVLDK